MPSLGWQEFTILSVLFVWWLGPIAYVARTARRRGGYTPWVAIVTMLLFGWMGNPLWALIWRLVQGPKWRGLQPHRTATAV